MSLETEATNQIKFHNDCSSQNCKLFSNAHYRIVHVEVVIRQ